MVKVCAYNYPKSGETLFKEHYEKYTYPLHPFQKWSIQCIVERNHLLICAPTGSGKTMPAEFALDYLHSLGKKTIYTSPIKALSNEKYHSFTQKFPHIRIGLITGDIKINSDADVLIMTTEILLNKLYQHKSCNQTQFVQTQTSATSFEMDLDNELACVVFDEIHMINDESRGHVWEQCIMLLPEHVQMIGLSATLDNPERFAYWLETKGSNETMETTETTTTTVNETMNTKKIVYLAKQKERSVPLIHYSFVVSPASIYKHIKDKATKDEVKSLTNKPFVLQNEKGVFQEDTFANVKQMLQIFDKNRVTVKKSHAINAVAEYLTQHEMLPALCYVFSRKQLEICANELTTNLLEFDSKIPYTVDRECEKIIRALPNFEEYLHLPEYVNVVKLLRKGVGIHHGGLMPILREMTELMFARGFIKMLFCTETMSVGINLPVKTTIFTDINKFNGEIIRTLYSHEYTQAAGRAGRLGLDKVGHVIHLNNLFRNVDAGSYREMMSGKSQSLLSKFKISYSLLLNLVQAGETNFMDFANKSMVIHDLDKEKGMLYMKMQEYEKTGDSSNVRTPSPILKEYMELLKNKHNYSTKKRKEAERNIQQWKDEYRFLENDRIAFEKSLSKGSERNALQKQMDALNNYVKNNVDSIMNILEKKGFLQRDKDDSIQLLLKGELAANLKELHGLIFATLSLDAFSAKELVALFSCFTNIHVSEDVKTISLQEDKTKCITRSFIAFLQDIQSSHHEYQDLELKHNVNTGFDYTNAMQYDLVEYVLEWCDSTSVEECKRVLQRMADEKDIFLGEFVKALLKINNISNEMEKNAERTGNLVLLSKLKEIPALTLKFVVTNQSLYV
jgi:superfamily II RNA helicase